MPAPLSVDREAVRVLVVALGCAEAARRMGLPLTAVQQWSSRGRWLAAARPQPPSQPPPPSMSQPVRHPVSGVSVSPAQALSDALADDSSRTRLSLSRTVRRVSEAMADQPPDEVDAQRLKATAQTGALVYGWSGAASVSVRVGVLTTSDTLPDVVIECDPEMVD